ncbi:mRNA interferase MazF [Microbacterium sp. ZKA21]|uniref:type II toxin-antitoxin system PemK/MazF family toxin n=1 Tax=Microbacterium sp. ZKA21 TaxID=3381694 RepID=UPI003D19C3A9
MQPTPDLTPGTVLWICPDATVGHEQSGRRPAVVVAGARYLDVVESMAIIVPVTSTDRGQVRAVARSQLHGHLGQADDDVLERIRHWLRKFLDL